MICVAPLTITSIIDRLIDRYDVLKLARDLGEVRICCAFILL